MAQSEQPIEFVDGATLLEECERAPLAPLSVGPPASPVGPAAPPLDPDRGNRDQAERLARRTLRAQIARLERELSDAVATAFPHADVPLPVPVHSAGPRMLGMGELERLRDRLAERVAEAHAAISMRARAQERNRVLLERMLLEPGRYKFMRIAAADVGEGGCGVYQVRPRLGIVGMLAGWWQVKLSSGCPLAGGPRAERGPGLRDVPLARTRPPCSARIPAEDGQRLHEHQACRLG